MSTTITETKTQANSLAMRSQPQEQEDDNLSQESYSTVAGSSQADQGHPSKKATQKKDQVSKENMDSDADEEEPSPCGRCRKMVIRGDEALLCDICERWFHIKCERVNKGQYTQLSKKTKSNFHWFCDGCDIIQTGVIKQMTLLKAENSEFKRRLDDMENTKVDKEDLQKEMEKKADKYDLKKLEERVTTIEGKQEAPGNQDTSNPVPSTSSGQQNADDVIKEIKEQEERKRNVMFFNLPESKAQDMNDRTKHDKEEVKEISKICQATIKKDDMIKAKRLGSKLQGDKPRPLLIELNSDEKKKALFMNLSKLKNAPAKYKSVSVQNDLTPKQRETEKLLREEAKKKEDEASGEAKFKVRGPPWNRRIIRVEIRKREN